MQKPTGEVDDSFFTITMSYGKDKVIETTSFAILSWMDSHETINDYAENIQLGVDFLISSIEENRFGST